MTHREKGLVCGAFLIALLSMLTVSGACAEDARSLIASLKSDDKPYNATRSVETLLSQAASLPAEAIKLLEKNLVSEDPQLSQYSAALLTQVYDKQRIKPESWPDTFMKTIVEGLRADDIYWPWTFQNHRMFLNYLYFLEEGFPLSLVQSELRGDNAQSRFGAAVLLAHHLRGTVQPEVGRVLLEHLKDDDQIANGRAAFQALAELGKPTFDSLMEQQTPADWQQAAYLQCLSAYFNSGWAAPDAYLEAWYARAMEQKGIVEVRLEIPALYLHPRAAHFLRQREMPSLLSRIYKGGTTLRTAHDKAEWLGTWFWFIKPRPALYPFFAQKPFMRYSEFSLSEDGDYFIALEAIAGIRP